MWQPCRLSESILSSQAGPATLLLLTPLLLPTAAPVRSCAFETEMAAGACLRSSQLRAAAELWRSTHPRQSADERTCWCRDPMGQHTQQLRTRAGPSRGNRAGGVQLGAQLPGISSAFLHSGQPARHPAAALSQ